MTVRGARPISPQTVSFGHAVEDARRAKGLTQRELIHRCVNAGYKATAYRIGKIERGEWKLSPTEVEILATVLDLSDAVVSAALGANAPVLPAGASDDRMAAARHLLRVGLVRPGQQGCWVAQIEDRVLIFDSEIDALRAAAGDKVRFATWAKDQR